MNYIGIDGCKKGWLYVQLDDAGGCQFGVISPIQQILHIAKTEDVVLLDIPIGLKTSGKDEPRKIK